MSKLYYRIDGRSHASIMPKLPLTKEEVGKLHWKEREMWFGLALREGETEEDLIKSFRSMSDEIKRKALKKLIAVIKE